PSSSGAILTLSEATSTAAPPTFGNFSCGRTASFTPLQKRAFTYARLQRRPAAVCTECAAILPPEGPCARYSNCLSIRASYPRRLSIISLTKQHRCAVGVCRARRNQHPLLQRTRHPRPPFALEYPWLCASSPSYRSGRILKCRHLLFYLRNVLPRIPESPDRLGRRQFRQPHRRRPILRERP